MTAEAETAARLARHASTEKQRHFESNFLKDAEVYETWDSVEIGKAFKGKLQFKVKEEDILHYNLAMGETDPLMIDPAAAREMSPTRELIQHPLFVVQVAFYCIENGPGSWIRSPGARNPGQKIELYEPFKIGETLTMTVVAADRWIRRGKHYITDKLDFHNEAGVLKATWWLTLIIPPNREGILRFAKM
jgi:acyl dehydratase